MDVEGIVARTLNMEAARRSSAGGEAGGSDNPEAARRTKTLSRAQGSAGHAQAGGMGDVSVHAGRHDAW